MAGHRLVSKQRASLENLKMSQEAPRAVTAQEASLQGWDHEAAILTALGSWLLPAAM